MSKIANKYKIEPANSEKAKRAEVEIINNKKPSCREDSRPYCFTADYLVISDCC